MNLVPIYDNDGRVSAIRDTDTGITAQRTPDTFTYPPEIDSLGLNEKLEWIAAQRINAAPLWCEWEAQGLITAELLRPRE